MTTIQSRGRVMGQRSARTKPSRPQALAEPLHATLSAVVAFP